MLLSVKQHSKLSLRQVVKTPSLFCLVNLWKTTAVYNTAINSMDYMMPLTVAAASVILFFRLAIS